MAERYRKAKRGLTKSIVSVTKWEDVKKVEEIEDCFILDFNPNEFPNIGRDHGNDNVKIVSVNRKEDVKKVEEIEDCFILEFDPFEDEECSRIDLMFNKLAVSVKTEVFSDHDDDCVEVLGVKGKVACRDYPHSRHLCAMHPFKNTSHQIHCKMCYCYVCDKAAPCKKWTVGCKNSSLKHCDATPDIPFWKRRRDRKKDKQCWK